MSEQASEITITKAGGKHKVGTVLRILAAGEDPAPGTVDRAKAASLVEEHKVAVWGERAEKPAGKRGKSAAGEEG